MNQSIQNTVHTPHPAQYNMVGQRLTQTLGTTEEAISPGMVDRLHRYALGRMAEAGFGSVIQGWNVEVYTLNGDLPRSERAYTVRWLNAAGGYIEVCGIETNKGWPSLDFGFEIGTC